MIKTFLNKKVVVTGHTGFKGSWLTAWLKIMGADIIGISLNQPTPKSHFQYAKIFDGIEDCRIDIRDANKIKQKIIDASPDFLFHLAAQPLVARSYEDPLETWNTNVIGTVNILDSLRYVKNQCTAVIITSDKCYDNVEWEWGYRENDTLGGPDPYSASKGAAEIAIRSYFKSYFKDPDNGIRIASARAGNVIGGGDWAESRIVPDCIKAWSQNKIVELRNPTSTRPWQHVLEPLGGYLTLAEKLSKNSELHGDAFNFGPPSNQNHSVLALVQEMSNHWEKVKWKIPNKIEDTFYESGLLKLNCDKALHFLDWQAILDFRDTVQLTAEWYKSFYENNNNVAETTNYQIKEYQKLLVKV
jgi:CDP-glucose 4,6-dehydratase